MQKFYNREKHLRRLRSLSQDIQKTKGRLSVVVGRRRVGKTRLLKEAFSTIDSEFLYLFISRKPEAALVEEFANLIAVQLDVKFFKPSSLRDIFEFLFHYSITTPITVVVDEFQDIAKINASLFSDLQNLWDSSKSKSMMHFLCCGSIYSLMIKIFKGSKEPLLNRDDDFFKIQPLAPSYIKEIMLDSNKYSPEKMLQWWCLSGGIPKYLEWLQGASDNVFNSLLSEYSPLIKEGVHRLVEDFGSEHRTYFSVLGEISKGNTTRARIEDFLKMGVGTVLNELEEVFDVIEKKRPLTSKENSRDVRYSINDPFLRFWFRFIYSNSSAVEMENFEYIRSVISRDFKTFSGIELESLFKALLIECKKYNAIGGYWDSKGHNEIDIIAVNDIDKKILMVEVKRQSKNYEAGKFEVKVDLALTKLKKKGYSVDIRCFSLDNMDLIFNEFLK